MEDFIVYRNAESQKERDAARINAAADAECERIVNQRAGSSAPQMVVMKKAVLQTGREPEPESRVEKIFRKMHSWEILGMVTGACVVLSAGFALAGMTLAAVGAALAAFAAYTGTVVL